MKLTILYNDEISSPGILVKDLNILFIKTSISEAETKEVIEWAESIANTNA